MAINEYKPTKKYDVGMLKPYVLLLPIESTLIDYEIDNGQCRVKGINASTIIRVEGLSASYSSEETLQGRFKFNNSLVLNVPEDKATPHFIEISSMLKGNYYTVFETNNGVKMLQSVDLPVEMTYSYNFTNQTTTANLCAITFRSYSNIPTMILDNVNLVPTQTLIETNCDYNIGRINGLKMSNFRNTIVVQDSNGKFNDIRTNGNEEMYEIKFDPQSFTYTETFDDNVFTQTLTFTIPLNEYKYYWHYNLIEFTNNRYVVMFNTECGNVILSGFEYGFTPTYTMASAEGNTSMDTITITLRHRGNIISASNVEGNYVVGKDEISLLTPELNYSDALGNTSSTVVCIDETTGVYTLMAEITSTGTKTGNYYCLEGYEDTYSTLNIVGTYSLDDDIGYPIKFQSAQCSTQQGCQFFVTPPSTINFSTLGQSFQYQVNGECDWHLENIPSWLSVLPQRGSANQLTTITLTATGTPTEDGQQAVIRIVGTDGNYFSFVVNYGREADWIDPIVFDITAQDQACICNLPNYYHNKPVSVVSHTGEGYNGSNIIGEELRLWVKENPSFEQTRQITVVVQNKLGETVNVIINQDKLYKRLVEVEGYLCDENNTSYKRMQIYKGYTPGNENIPTEAYDYGDVILENDTRCTQQMTEWRDTDETICSQSNEYKKQQQYVSYNGGQDWVATGETRTGDLVEENSPKCDSRYQWINTGNDICVSGNLYQQLAKTYTPEGGQPTYTGEIKTGELIKAQAPQCVGLEDASISFTYTNRDYEMNTNEPLCQIYSAGAFTVNFGDGQTESVNTGEAINGKSFGHNWGYHTEFTHTIQIYGRVDELHIFCPGEIEELDVEKGGALKKIIVNDYVGELNELRGETHIKSFDLTNCANLEELIINKHTGIDGIVDFLYPEESNMRVLTIENAENDECYITPEQLQAIIDSAPSITEEGEAGIMSFCDCVYNDHGTPRHLACEANTISLQAKNWLYNTPCCASEGMKKYQTVIDEGNVICDGTSFNKVQMMNIQVSTYTGGKWSAWEDTQYKIKGEIVEYNSTDCGFKPPYMEEWRLNENYYVCVDTTSYYANVKYESLDGGVTWSIKQPMEMENSGQVRKMDDEDCGYIPPGTYRERWVVVPGEYYCREGEGEINECGFYNLWTPFGFNNGTFKDSDVAQTVTTLPEICDGNLFTNIDHMFENMLSLQLFPVFDASNVKSADSAFYNCVKLAETDEYKVSQYSFDSLTDATSMFENCTSLTKVTLNMPSVRTLDYIFWGTQVESIIFEDCGPVESLDHWLPTSNPGLREIRGLDISGMTGDVDVRGSNLNVRNMEYLDIKGTNCTLYLNYWPILRRESIEYIIQNAQTHGNAKLVFSSDQYQYTVSDEMVGYMESRGIEWTIA